MRKYEIKSIKCIFCLLCGAFVWVLNLILPCLRLIFISIYSFFWVLPEFRVAIRPPRVAIRPPRVTIRPPRVAIRDPRVAIRLGFLSSQADKDSNLLARRLRHLITMLEGFTCAATASPRRLGAAPHPKVLWVILRIAKQHLGPPAGPDVSVKPRFASRQEVRRCFRRTSARRRKVETFLHQSVKTYDFLFLSLPTS